MNQTQADSVKDLAKSVVETLGVITEKECARCYGSGTKKVGHPRQTGGSWRTGRFPCNVCNGTGKVRWKWEPHTGDMFILPRIKNSNELGLVIDADGDEDLVYYNHEARTYDEITLVKLATPILHWETLIGILKQNDYQVTVTYDTEEEFDERAYSNIWRDGKYLVEDERGKDCQSTVMKAVIKLGEEIHGAE